MSVIRCLSIVVVFLCASLKSMNTSGSMDSVTVTGGIESQLRNMKKVDISEVNFREDALRVHAFNVGQANFIVLRLINDAVIIDAGAQNDGYFPDEDSLDIALGGATVKAVFLTHPHRDHFSLFLKDILLSRYAFDETFFILGGKKSDWKSEGTRNELYFKLKNRVLVTEDGQKIPAYCFLDDLAADHEIFLERQYIPNVTFRIFDVIPLSMHKQGEENKLSPLIRVSFAGNNMLFLGDAEGDSLSRFFRVSADLSALIPLYPDFAQLSGTLNRCINEQCCIPEDFSQKYWEAYEQLGTQGICPDIFELIGEMVTQRSPETFHSTFMRSFLGALGRIFQDQSKKPQYLVFMKEIIEFIKTNEEYDDRLNGLINEIEGLQKSKFSKSEIIEKLEKQLKENCYDLSLAILRIFLDVICLNIREDAAFLPKTRSFILTELFRLENDSAKYYNDLTIQLVRTLTMRKLFRDSQIIFLPHHGTHTKNSQSFLGLFAGSTTPHVFVVSSSPFGRDQLPKASTYDMTPPYPIHPLHYFMYSRDYLDMPGHVQLKLTNKPIYMTGAAPGGVFILMICNDSNSYILDLICNDMIRPDSNLWRWILLPNDLLSHTEIVDQNLDIVTHDSRRFDSQYYKLTS